MSAVVTIKDVVEAVERLNLHGRAVELHVSLRSFPRLGGGPRTLVDVFLEADCTLLVPTMANEAFAIPAPLDDRPARNGIDFDAEDTQLRRRSAAASDVYDASRTEIDSGLGATPAYVAARPGRLRSKYPVGTFSAIGPRARDLINAETPDDVFGPLRALAVLDGTALLVACR